MPTTAPPAPMGGCPRSVTVTCFCPQCHPPAGGTHPSALLARLAPGARLALKHRKGRVWWGAGVGTGGLQPGGGPDPTYLCAILPVAAWGTLGTLDGVGGEPVSTPGGTARPFPS